MAYTPPFSITDEVVNLVGDISLLVGKLSVSERLSKNPHLRRESRIRSIHSSLAIENNTLSLDEVTALIDGKRVLAPPKDIREVQNAYEAYEALSGMDPYSMDDLLKAHAFMMAGLTRDAGCFRSGDVGVFAGDVLIHAGTPAAYVPQVMADLFEWLRTTDTHPLVASCVFHSEFEYIHPFSDGNGRTGRLWHSLLLQSWNPLFAWLPVESLVAQHQTEYYDALERTQADADCTPFVVFMLRVIRDTIQDACDDKINDNLNDKINGRQQRLVALLKDSPTSTLNDLATELGISPTTAQRDLAHLQKLGIIRREGSRKTGLWVVV